MASEDGYESGFTIISDCEMSFTIIVSNESVFTIEAYNAISATKYRWNVYF